MERRSFLAGPAAGLPLMTYAQTESKSQAILELRYLWMRNTRDNQRARTAEFLARSATPAYARIGTGPLGLFASSIGPDAPFALMVVQHDSLAAFEHCYSKLRGDEEFVAASRALSADPNRPFERMEVRLLRGFRGFPRVEVPESGEQRAPRVFELRTYESDTPASLFKKIGMFEGGEIDIFRKYGLAPVFFGETLAGPRMPSLTYMVAFDNLTAREKCWSAFGGSPEWAKLRATPGLGDGEVVSNITNLILAPMNGSAIR